MNRLRAFVTNMPTAENLVTLIAFIDHSVWFANTREQKSALLTAYKMAEGEKRLVAAWTGKTRSDVFEITVEQAEAALAAAAA